MGRPLPARPRRIPVAGTSGSGKSTLAAALSASLGLPHVDIDGLYHGPGWTPRPAFAAEVAAFAATEEWVTEWQYSAVRPLLLARADLLVWLDLSRLQVLRQLVPRTSAQPPLVVRLRNRREVQAWLDGPVSALTSVRRP